MIKTKQKQCKECEKNLAGWKRALADYENLKKQTQKEKESFAKFANLNLILNLIPVYNNFKISFEHLPKNLKDDNWVKGVIHIENQFKQILEQNGVEEINPKVGDEFDVNLHEAIQQSTKRQNDKTTNDKIQKVVNCGYKLKGRVFLPAKVIVK